MDQLHHSRIDQGQARELTTKPLDELTPLNPKPVASRSEIVSKAIQEHAEGKSLREIAQHLDVSYEGLRIWMLSEQPEEYRKAQELGLISRIVYADRDMDRATNPLDIARARENGKYARWDAERRLPHLFGQKQEPTNTLSPILNITINTGTSGVTITHDQIDSKP